RVPAGLRRAEELGRTGAGVAAQLLPGLRAPADDPPPARARAGRTHPRRRGVTCRVCGRSPAPPGDYSSNSCGGGAGGPKTNPCRVGDRAGRPRRVSTVPTAPARVLAPPLLALLAAFTIAAVAFGTETWPTHTGLHQLTIWAVVVLAVAGFLL